MKLKTLTVSQVNDYISNYMSINPIFSNINISGEIFNLKKTEYGYTFLSLKDKDSKLNAITYLDYFDVKNGDYIIVNGKISFYKKNGTYSLIINGYEKLGQGSSYEQFKILYKQLESLGYFKQEIKKRISKFPEKIAVVTSANGAAIKDIISVIERKYPKVKLIIYNCKMQGIDCENNIVDAIRNLDNMSIDTIIISRGGGDSDDLDIFNSKLIAKSIFESNTPIISAIGHEVDYVICDFVSDLRAPTPSIAAELSIPNLEDIYETIFTLENSIKVSYQSIINKYSSKINSYKFLLQSNTPYNKINQKRLFINNLLLIIEKNYKKHIENYKEKIINLNSVLEENNFSKILSKGFVTIEKDGKLIKSYSELSKNDKILLKFKDGYAKVIVEETF